MYNSAVSESATVAIIDNWTMVGPQESWSVAQLKDYIDERLKSTAKDAWLTGKALAIAKKKVGHGNWRTWLKENVPQLSERSVQYRLQIQSTFSLNEVEGKSLKDVIRMLSGEKPKEQPSPTIAASPHPEPAIQEPHSTPPQHNEVVAKDVSDSSITNTTQAEEESAGISDEDLDGIEDNETDSDYETIPVPQVLIDCIEQATALLSEYLDDGGYIDEIPNIFPLQLLWNEAWDDCCPTAGC